MILKRLLKLARIPEGYYASICRIGRWRIDIYNRRRWLKYRKLDGFILWKLWIHKESQSRMDKTEIKGRIIVMVVIGVMLWLL